MIKAVNQINMRLLLILILSILSLIFCASNINTRTAFAQDADIPQISAESKTVHRGQTFSIDVELSNNVGLISLCLELGYDDSAMVLRDVIQGDALSSMNLTKTNVETEQGYGIESFRLLWDSREPVYSNGVIITFIFDSFIDAPIGEYEITLENIKENTNIEYKVPIDLSITNSIVTLITGEYNAIYRDYNGEILYEKDYNADDIPSYPDSLPPPSREEDAEYSYEFIGWKGVVSDDVNVLIFEADYKLTPQKYTVFVYVDGVKFSDEGTPTPDGIIDDDDYFYSAEISFGEVLEIPNVLENHFYQFYGWYLDDGFQIVSTYVTMPSKDIRLYGYYALDIRDKNVPLISLNAEYTDENLEDVVVTVELMRNSGFNGLVLVLRYDRDIFTFEGFDGDLGLLKSMNFDTTNPDDLSVEDFKFYYESATNNYETGAFLKLYFKVKPNAPDNNYEIYFEYEQWNTTYVDSHNDLKYTKIEFYNAEVPVGEKFYWESDLGGDRFVDVTSETGKPINVYLEVNLVTESIYLDEELIKGQVGRGFYLSSAYKIVLMQNRQEIQPNTTLIIRIKLTANEQKGKIKFYYLNDDNELSKHDFKIEDGTLVFKTDHLSNWVIFSNYRETVNSSSILFLVGMPIILAIATMLYALRLKQMNKKEKEAHID